jgi:hypothetical protein
VPGLLNPGGVHTSIREANAIDNCVPGLLNPGGAHTSIREANAINDGAPLTGTEGAP